MSAKGDDLKARLVVWCEGDPSVGIAGDQALVEVWAASEAHKHEMEADAAFREGLVNLFAALWDWAPRHVHVMRLDETDADGEDESND